MSELHAVTTSLAETALTSSSSSSASSASSSHSPIAKINNLIQELKVYGGYVCDNVEVKEDASSGNGIFATADVPEGTVLVSVPFALCISSDAIVSFGPLAKIFEENPGLLDYQDEVLAIGLMYSRLVIDAGSRSLDEVPWAKHVATMPTSLNTPLFWSDAELEMLRPSNAYHLTKLLRKTIENDWESIHAPLAAQYPLIADINIELYKWALSMVYSRAFGFYRKEGEYIRCIVPVLDMANHNPEIASCAEQTFGYDDVSNTIKLSCPKIRKAGEECYAYYGTYPNAKLLYTYGFTIVGCKQRTIDLWTRVVPSTSSAEKKSKIISENPLTNNQTYDFKGTISDNYVSPALLATIRVIQATEEELTLVDNAFNGKIISVRNELATYKALRELVVARMNPSLAEVERRQLGEMLLGNVPSSDRALMALIVKVDERDLLQDTIPLIDSWVAKLEESDSSDKYTPPDYVFEAN